MNIEMLGQYDPYAEISTPEIEYTQTRDFAPSYADIVTPGLDSDYASLEITENALSEAERDLAEYEEPGILQRLFSTAADAYTARSGPAAPAAVQKPNYTPMLLLGGGAVAIVAILAATR